MLVITVAPQKDICPHGSTYPKKAAAIKRNKIPIPEIHTWLLVFGELFIIPRNMWMYIIRKKNDARFKCKNRNSQPLFVFRVMWITVSKALSIFELYCVANTIPVATCAAKQIPNREPKFHR